MRATVLHRAGDVRVADVPEPGHMFDRPANLEEVPDGYRAMDRRGD